jgi:hypothetical protein
MINFSFINTFNYANYLLPPPPSLLHYAFIINLFTHLTTLGRNKFLLDDYFLLQIILIMQTTYNYHQNRFFSIHSFFTYYLTFTTLGCKKFFHDDFFLLQTLLIMQTTYFHHRHRYFTMHAIFIYSLILLL